MTRDRSPPPQLAGGWELGLLALMAGLYAIGTVINPDFFGTTDAVSAVLRDTARVGVMAVGMCYVIVCKELDLSVGSVLGLTAVVFSIAYDPNHSDLPIGWAILAAVVVGLLAGLFNAALVTALRVPAFIATLTTLFIGRGLVLAATGGQTIGFDRKALGDGWFFAIGETNAWGFNNQILVFLVVAGLGMVWLAKTRLGYETTAIGGNSMAAGYAGIGVFRARLRVYLFSALAATLAGLMNVAQDKGVNSQYGQGAELIVIASVIVGGASIAGGRGRVLGACLGAALVVLIDKVLREGIPITTIMDVAGIKMEVRGYAQLPGGAVQACLGLILLGAVLIEPWAARGGAHRLWSRLRGRGAPPADRGRGRHHRRADARERERFPGRGGAGPAGLSGAARCRGDSAQRGVVGLWPGAAAGFLGLARQQLFAGAGVHRGGVCGDRHDLCADQRRCRSLGGLGAGAVRRGCVVSDEGDGDSAAGRGVDCDGGRRGLRADQWLADRALPPARLRGDAGHAVYCPRRGRVAGGRAAAFGFLGWLQPDGTQPV